MLKLMRAEKTAALLICECRKNYDSLFCAICSRMSSLLQYHVELPYLLG